MEAQPSPSTPAHPAASPAPAEMPVPAEVGTVGLGSLLAALAHDLRNPLASLQGSAQTLALRGEDLSPEVRSALAEVIADQAQRMDWYVRALAVYGGADPSRLIEGFDLGEVVEEAARLTGAAVKVHSSRRVEADGKRLRTGLEAALLAAAPAGGGVRVYEDRVEMDAPTFPEHGSGVWKLQMAAGILRGEGALLVVVADPDAPKLRVRFGSSDGRP